MKDFLVAVKSFIILHKKAIIITASSIVGLAILAAGVVMIVLANQVKIVYQPVDACSLLTPDEARTLLGDKALNGNHQKPVITKNDAASSCTYADTQTKEDDDTVIAISVRSAINDAGIQQNIGDFVLNKPNVNIMDVKDTNNLEYFNTSTGVFNILSDSGKRWIRLSYGIGSDPQGNTLADAQKLAALVLN
jgi:hypothetical protein